MSRYAGQKTGKKTADEETAQKIIAALENESIKYETYFKLTLVQRTPVLAHATVTKFLVDKP